MKQHVEMQWNSKTNLIKIPEFTGPVAGALNVLKGQGNCRMRCDDLKVKHYCWSKSNDSVKDLTHEPTRAIFF